ELTEEQIQALMGDTSTLSELQKKIRRWAVKRYRERWKKIEPAKAQADAENDKIYEAEVGDAIPHHITTFRRALGRRARRRSGRGFSSHSKPLPLGATSRRAGPQP